jgi:hypothetical protein
MTRFVFSKDDMGFYITPLIGFSWGKAYGKCVWVGWLRYLVQFNFKQ